MQQYNLVCSKDYLIGAIGSLYFAGWAAFALVLPAKADAIGRKKISCITLLITACSVTLLLVGTQIYVLLLASLILGLMSTGRVAVSFVYMIEFFTPEWRT